MFTECRSVPDGTRLGPERSWVAEEWIPVLWVWLSEMGKTGTSVYSLCCAPLTLNSSDLRSSKPFIQEDSAGLHVSWHGEPPANVHTVCIKCRITLDIRKQSRVTFSPCAHVQFCTYFSSHLSLYSLFRGW